MEQVRVALCDYKDKTLIDLRIYYQDDTGEWRPTKRGIAFTLEQWPELRDALAKLEQALRGHRGALRIPQHGIDPP